MKTYQEMLKAILKSSGWSQQRLAYHLGVSFPTVNYWLNNKVVPRKKMQGRIKNLYLARYVPSYDPTFITFRLNDTTSHIDINDRILLFQTNEKGPYGYGVIGIKYDDYTDKTITLDSDDNSQIIIPVAFDESFAAKGTETASFIHDKIYPGAYARVMFILKCSAIAVIEDWGLEI